MGTGGVIDWHARYVQQARWTRPLRSYLLARAGLGAAKLILEVGCGTGAVLADLPKNRARVHGLDIDDEALAECRVHVPDSQLTTADALAMPYRAETFDIVFCHYLLLWVSDPVSALIEMRRVARQGGAILALAEPDHEQRTDQPAPLEEVGRLQTEALRSRGADTRAGRNLVAWFRAANITIMESGPIAAAAETMGEEDRALEWSVFEADVGQMVDPAALRRFKEIDAEAWQSGARILNVPTYFALGRAHP